MNELLPRRGSTAHTQYLEAAEQAHEAIVALEAKIPPNAAKAYKSLYDQKMSEPASDKQRSYIADLIRKHDTVTGLSRPLGQIPADMDKALAHRTIEWLKARPLKPLETVVFEQLVELAAKPVPVPPRVLTPGAYRSAMGYIYNVSETTKRAAWGGETIKSLKVKRYNADTESFEYVGGPSSLPADAVRITVAEAIEFGQRTTFCCVCGRHLSNPISVAAGIGPICAGRQ